jgi:Hsp20/alpha crystallin family
MPHHAGVRGWSIAGGGVTRLSLLRSTLGHRHGKFAYRTRPPDGADPEEVDAQLTGGILPVRLPNAAQTRSRQPEHRRWISERCAVGGVAARSGGRCHKTVTLLPRPA